MVLFHAAAGILAGLLAIAAYVPYIISILKGETKPNRASFLIWTVVDIVFLSSYIASGARTTIWVGLVYCIFQLMVLVLAIRRGVGGFGKLDITCIVGAGFGILFWIITNDARTALYISICCEILGFMPTIKKAYLQPETESQLAWNVGVFASAFNLLAINKLQPEIYVYPIYNIIFVGIVAGLLTRDKFHSRKT